jgi:hypothetical protein
MRRIREEYIEGTSCTVVLVGSGTSGRKSVAWEIRATLDKQHGLIGVQLPSLPVNPITNRVQVPARLFDNNTGYSVWITWDQLTQSAAQPDCYIADATARRAAVIDNTRPRQP